MLLGLCAIGVTDRAAAQQTREEQIALEQTEKPRNLHPYEPTTLERRIETIQKSLHCSTRF